MAAILLFFWAVRIESYPLTAWQMYSSAKDAGRVDYQKVTAIYESGASGRAPLAVGIPALDRPLVAGTRYRRLLGRSFDRPEERKVAEELLRTSAERYNRGKPAGEGIAAIEVERWIWVFKETAEPGELDGRFRVAVE